MLINPVSVCAEIYKPENVNNVTPSNEPAVVKLQGEVKQEQLPAQETRFNIWQKQDNIAEDWFNYKNKLNKKGVNYNIMYVDDLFQKIYGGNSSKSPLRYNGYVKSSLELDTHKMGLWTGGKANITVPYKFGRGLSPDYMHTEVSYSNINVKEFLSLGEFWYEQSLFSDAFKVKIGKQDLENDCAVLSDSYNFINDGLSENPTIPLPAISKTAIGVLTTVAPVKSIKLKTGIFDGNAKRERLGFGTLFTGSYFNIAEGEADYSINKLPGTAKIGYWYRNGGIDEITSNPVVHHFQSNYGAYSAAKQMLFKENKSLNDQQGLYTHVLFGWTPSDRNELSKFYALGMQYKGLFAKRNNDIAGISSSFAQLSNQVNSMHGRSHETSIESFYRIQITRFFAFQPDFQVIFRPNGNGKTTWLFGIRTFISL